MRKCNCSGNCGPQSDGLSRREFLELTAAGAFLATPALAATFDAPPDELERWKRELALAGQPRVYRSDQHTDARLHLGGIGTGNFEVGADGQFTTWQLFNTLRDGHVPFHFAVKAGNAVRLLQTAGGPAAQRIARIDMTGEYPMAHLQFIDPALPVNLELDAFSPFAPLDTPLSSTPLAMFVFRITNRTATEQTVSLAGFLQNPVGYDATSRNDNERHPSFGANVNAVLRIAGGVGLAMRAEAGAEATLDQPVHLFATANLAGLRTPPPDRPSNLTFETLDRLPGAVSKLDAPERTLLWLEEPAADLPEPLLRAARDAVHAGATLVFAGKSSPLLSHFGRATRGQPLGEMAARPDILFDDFESGYGKWTVTGAAFGQKPAGGTLSGQQRVSGFLGKGLVNTFLEGDAPTGRAVSRDFAIERRFIRFLIGGGSQANTQLRLVVGGRVVRSASGRDNERLEPSSWDVAEFEGKTAHLEIVDEATGPWGHVNVDQIEFSDHPANRAVLVLLEELLPVRFTEARAASDAGAGNPNSLALENLQLRDGTRTETTPHGLRLFVRAVEKGRVVLATGPFLVPEQASVVAARQRAYAALCGLVGAKYTPITGQHPKAPGFGTLAFSALDSAPVTSLAAADASQLGLPRQRPLPLKVTVLPAAENLDQAWRQFAERAEFGPADSATANAPTPDGRTVFGAVASTVNVPPQSAVEMPFLLAWHYPNKYNAAGVWMGCHHTTRWPDAAGVMRAAVETYPLWRGRTESFRRVFYDSSLPWWLLDCLTANAAIIRHIGVTFRIANGDTYGWEGSNGCCQPTCTHVWGYEQTLARLFPDLERDMRRIDFKHQQRADGGVNNRTDVPSPPKPTGEQPFADGHASCILKAYREALNTPDETFFTEYWPHIKRAVDYLIARDAKSHGGQPSGYLEDDQWNTYDEALHGVTTFISGYYLAALRAGEEWARRAGERPTAERFHAVFEKGQAKLIELCWDGEYFRQQLPDYEKRPGEVGPGCMSDQLIGQWWAHQLGLGYILPRDKVLSALRSIYKYNFKTDLTGWKHLPRAFAGAKDKGLIICTWPKGGRPPRVMLYSDEVWTGIEYQVAAHMIYEGLIEEGLAIAKAARDRYDGLPRAPIQRNPWNEIECGGHYARAMSSWSLLLALSGWEYDGPRGALRLGPKLGSANFKGFWCGPQAWGDFTRRVEGAVQRETLEVTLGSFRVTSVAAALAANLNPSRVTVTLNGQAQPATLKLAAGTAEIQLPKEVALRERDKLEIVLA